MSIKEIPGLLGNDKGPELGKYNKAVPVLAAITAILVFLAFIPALDNGFVNLDDSYYVHDNPFIRSIDTISLKWVGITLVGSNWHPLTVLSHVMDHALWGYEPWGHHLTNVILHALNTALVMVVTVWLTGLALTSGLRRMKPDEAYERAIYAGLLAALLFGLHPLRVESVAWVSERKDVLCGFFFLLTIIAYLGYATAGEGRGKISYAISLLFCFAALMSKPMAISLPVVLLIIDFYPLDRHFWEGRRILIEKTPFFALGLLSAVMTILAQKAGGAIGSLEAHPLVVRLLVAVRAAAFYLYKMVWPLDLAPYYPYPAGSWHQNTEFAGAVILFVAITIICVATLRRTRVFSAVWAYYLVTLTPVAGIVQVGTQAAADRYTYLPSLAPTMFVAVVAALILNSNLRQKVAAASWAVIIIVLGALCALTVMQTHIWKDSVTLWTYVIKYYEYTPEADMARILAYYNRGKAYDLKGEFGQAVADYDRVIVLSPGNVSAYINRGTAYARTGSLKRALWDFDSAVKLDPKDADAYYNRGLAHLALGEAAMAIDDLVAAADLRPGSSQVYLALEKAYIASGDKEKAREAKKRALSLGSL